MKHFILITSLFFMLSLVTACSNNNTAKRDDSTNVQLGTLKKVEFGSVVSVKNITIKPTRAEAPRSSGNIGVNVGSGGTGIYGTVDVATLTRLFSESKTKTVQEIIIKKEHGELVVVTQKSKEVFNKGDKVKILSRNNKAIVIH
jgi:outer membrane lipoprotein SlyB